jgi:hypothetical protein
MTLRAQARVGEDLGDGIAGGRGLFVPICFAKRLDVIEGMVVGNKLERVGYAVDDVPLSNHGHGISLPVRSLAARLQVEIIEVRF